MLAGLLTVLGCDDRPRQWDAFVYPDAEGSEFYETIEGFRSFELCRQAALNRIGQLKMQDKAAYECGYRCRHDPQMKIHICKETRD